MFGDSLTTSPSYASPLALWLNAHAYQELATGGWTATQLLAGIQGSSIPAAVDTSVVVIGINDVIGGVAEATIKSNLTAIEAALPDPHFVTIPPFGNASSWDLTAEALRDTINTWMLANLDNVTDIEGIVGDEDPTQPVLLSAYDGGDGLHWNHDCDRRVAEALFFDGYGGQVLA